MNIIILFIFANFLRKFRINKEIRVIIREGHFPIGKGDSRGVKFFGGGWSETLWSLNVTEENLHPQFEPAS